MVEFPDGMSGDDMKAALDVRFGQPSQSQQDSGPIWQGDINQYAEDAAGPSFTELATTSLIHPSGPIPRIPGPDQSPPSAIESIAELGPAGAVLPKPVRDVGASVGRGILNQIIGLAEFSTSPAGLATAGVGSLSAIAGRALAGAYGLDTLRNLYRQVVDTHKNWDSMTVGQRATALTDMAASGVFAWLLGKHAIKGAESAPTAKSVQEVPQQVMPEPINTPQSVNPDTAPIA